MDLKQIEYFVRVAELGSFTRAAIALNVAQPALSRQVRLLEVELHQHLLIRNGRGATLTDAGRLMLEHGRGILHQVTRAREELDRAHGVLAGAVALGLPPSLARLLTVPLLHAFRAQFPRAKLSITEGLSLSMQEWLRSGRLDVALLYGPPKSDELEGRHLMDEPLFAVAPRSEMDTGAGDYGAPISLAELARRPLVMPSQPNALRMLLERHMIDAGYKPTIEVEVDGVTAILELVSEGIGLAVLPAHTVRSAAHSERYILRPIGPPRILEQVWLVSSTRRARTLTQQALIELIGKLAPQLTQCSAAR